MERSALVTANVCRGYVSKAHANVCRGCVSKAQERLESLKRMARIAKEAGDYESSPKRLTPERLLEIRDLVNVDGVMTALDANDELLAHIDSQQVEIDRLLKANDYLRGQIFRGPGACYCVCHNPLSSCGYCQHCKGDNSVGEFHRLRALLGEALTALRHVETDTWLDCCRNAIAPVLAKLAQEGDRG